MNPALCYISNLEFNSRSSLPIEFLALYYISIVKEQVYILTIVPRTIKELFNSLHNKKNNAQLNQPIN